MIYVTSLDGTKTEPLINVGKDFRIEQSVDGSLTVSFTVVPSVSNGMVQNPGYSLLGPESVVNAFGYDFKVKMYDDAGFSKSIQGVSTFFENSKRQVYGIFSGSHTLANHLNFAMPGSGWSYTVDPDIANITNYITKLGDDNIVALVNKIIKYHQVEYVILPNNHIRFSKRVGPDSEHQYRWKKNISDVVLTEDSTNLFTYIKGFGKDGLEVVYESPNLSKFGKLEQNPVRDERFTDPVALTNYIKNSITDVPELAIESSMPELTSRETGERVWLIYPPLDLIVETRILRQTKMMVNGKLITETATLGNTIPKTSTDSLLDQQEEMNDNKDQIEDKVEQVQEDIFIQFEATEERIIDQYNTITSEYTASIFASAEEIRTEMAQKETNINNTIGAQYNKITSEYTSSISQTAQSLRQEFNASIVAVGQDIVDVRNYASTIEQTASMISQTVSSQQVQISNQGTRISSAESSIVQQSNQISQKVSTSDYTGQRITSLINQDPYSVTIEASKISLNGAVMVNGSISGTTNIDVTTDINLGRQIKFSDFTTISGDNGNIHIDAWGDINYTGTSHRFNGSIIADSLSATDVGGYTFSASSTGLTVRQYGAFKGICTFA